MVDLDSDPTKLIEIVEIGKQLLITRGALTTFSIANDVAKYFAIIPAMFAAVYPGPGQAQRDAAALAAVGDPVRRHLQRARDRRARSRSRCAACATARRARSAMLRRNLCIYGARRHRRAVPRHQARRPRSSNSSPGSRDDIAPYLPAPGLGRALRMLLVLTVLFGVAVPARDHRGRAAARAEVPRRRIAAHARRPVVGSSLLGQSFTDAKGARCRSTSRAGRRRAATTRPRAARATSVRSRSSSARPALLDQVCARSSRIGTDATASTGRARSARRTVSARCSRCSTRARVCRRGHARGQRQPAVPGARRSSRRTTASACSAPRKGGDYSRGPARADPR